MVIYEVGKPFPNYKKINQDACVARLNSGGFDAISYLQKPTSREKKTFCKSFMRVYTYISPEDIPLIAVKYLDNPWTWDVSISALGPQVDFDQFMTPGNLVNLFLVDRDTGVLFGGRTIGFSHEIMDEIKAACLRQREKYTSQSSLDFTRAHLLNTISTTDIIKLGKMQEFKG